ncbi:protein rep [Ligilactobacillus agilis]|uniref:protein rep n=1 Tax=Ligilactobacillus agilis TaxID=1601 RepID=UPI003F8B7706
MSKSKLLNDVSKNGYKRPWREKKLDSLTYSEYLEILNFKKAHNVKDCGETLEFVKTKDGRLKLYRTWFCHSRLCPLCAWRYSIKNSYEVSKILDTAKNNNEKIEFLFLTLTLKNVDLKALKGTIKTVHNAFHKLLQYKRVSSVVQGYIRSTEITINKQTNQAHPHVHAVLVVPKGYARRKQLKRYIDVTEWQALWRKALKADYDPIVNIQKIKARKRKGKKAEKSELAAAKETAKYQVKSSDYITGDRQRDLLYIEHLEQALANTRQFGFGGVLKDIRHDLKLDEKEDDLINIDNEKETENELEKVTYRWNFKFGNYVQISN